MSTESPNHTSKDKEHGATRSYIIGFILSLLYTVLPYQLVVHKTISGTALLVVILSIAVLQMAIQLLFFLHLGRGPKPLYNVVFFFATAGVIVLTIGASLFIMNNLYHNMTPKEVTQRVAQEENIAQIGGEQTGACAENETNHTVTIKAGRITPAFTRAERCDTLTLVNEDGQDLHIGFGSHDAAKSYGGHYEVPVRADRPEIITLNQPGDFNFFTHEDMDVTASFSVEP